VNLISTELARTNNLAPLKVDENIIYVVIDDIMNFKAIGLVRTATKRDIRLAIAPTESIVRYIDRIYGDESTKKAIEDFHKEMKIEAVTSDEEIASSEAQVSSAPIVRLLNSILEQAIEARASDIHIEPTSTSMRVRMRVDGSLETVLESPKNISHAVVTRAKILANLNIADHRSPQDGRFFVKINDREVDVRMSTIPCVYGEKVVLRLLDRRNFLIPKEKLGFTAENIKKFDNLLKNPHGILLVAGPTGSGKSTTLYTALNEMNQSTDNISTIEDPVEYMLDGINQLQVNTKAGMTFAKGLRALLRQDPDKIMIGEIRDSETVEIAIRAAITGHLVLSTIHTNDAVSAVSRLQDMGVESYLIASSLVGVVSQRLVRKICISCKQKHTLSNLELDLIGFTEKDNTGFYKGIGCPSCNNTGYKGRIAVHEILTFNSEIRNLVHKNAPIENIQNAAVQEGMIPLRESAISLLKDGITTVDEVIKITHGI